MKLDKPSPRWIATLMVSTALVSSCGFKDDTSEPMWQSSETASTTQALVMSSVYQTGPLEVKSLDAPSFCPFRKHLPPTSTRIHAPKAPGVYPVIMLTNCFICESHWLDEVFTHVASHGFVVIIPKLHDLGNVLFSNDLSFSDAEVVGQMGEWINTDLNPYLDAHLAKGSVADPTELGLVGFSSGGKVAWIAAEQQKVHAKAIAGIAPVDSPGDPFGLRPEPLILDKPFTFNMPSLIIGTGYDAIRMNSISPICAPEGHNHVQFYEQTKAPAWHVVATQNGHVDVIDKIDRWIPSMACPSAGDPQLMRHTVKGLLTAFFRGSLRAESTAYDVLTQAQLTPTEVTAEHKL